MIFRKAISCSPLGWSCNSRQLMLAAAMNHATVSVRRKPIVAVLANGDELVQPGQSPGRGTKSFRRFLRA